ncbi:MAG: VOC family protein [Acidimicrobiales bacterium]
MPETYPTVLAVVLDSTNARSLAEFYRRLLGYEYRPGDECPPAGEPDPKGEDWLVLTDPAGTARLAFQQVDKLPSSTWPEPVVPQQLHLDFGVASAEELTVQHDRALSMGASVLEDRFDDPDEQLYVFADPASHPFCILVTPS